MRRLLVPLALALAACLAAPAVQAQDARVIGGGAADSAQWPFAVAIETAFGGQFCGGSLVAPQWVLTAGHCRLYAASAIEVLTGSADLRRGGERIGVTRQVRNPRYRQSVPGAPRHDLMLLRLERASAATPIRLGERGEGLDVGTRLHVAGWGSTSYDAADDVFGPGSNVLRETAVRVRANDRCARAYGGAYRSAEMLCAALPGRDACAGDSGGPLVRGLGGDAALVGVVSWGTGCALAGYPGVYARVAATRCWITAVIGPPRAPSAVVVAEGAESLQVDWRWSRPCPDAPAPAGYIVRIPAVGAEVETGPDTRRVVVDGLPTGVELTATVVATGENGPGGARSATGTTGANPVLATAARWTGYRTAAVAFTLAAHAAAVRWRVEAGPRLRLTAHPWRTAAPSAEPQDLAAVLAALPVGRAVDVRIVVDEGARVAHGAPVQIPQPQRPAPIGGVRVRGSLAVGATATCAVGRWSGTRPFAVTRRWLAGGRPLDGATARTLRVTRALAGRAIACRVRVAGPGGVRSATSPRRMAG